MLFLLRHHLGLTVGHSAAGVEVPSKDSMPKKKPVYGDKRKRKPNVHTPEGNLPIHSNHVTLDLKCKSKIQQRPVWIVLRQISLHQYIPAPIH